MDILISEEAGVRSLHFGSSWVQGAMRVARPWSLELEYTREMMMALLFRQEPRWPRQVLLIGLGTGSLTKFLYKYRPDSQLTVVEIEPAVHAAAQMHFKLPAPSKQLHVVIDDGAEFIANTDRTFDLIMIDGFDENARVGALNSTPFYLNAKACLSEHGLVVCNLLSRQKDFEPGIARLKEAFDGRAIALDSCDSGNVIAFAAAGEPIAHSISDLKAQAAVLKAETGLNLAKTLSRLEQHPQCAGGQLEL